MKFALCISGYFNNKNEDDLLATNYIHDNVITPILNNDDSVDIFIHSFDKNNESNILIKYPNLTNYIIEHQYDFINNLDYKNKQYYDKLLSFNYHHYGQYNAQSSLSFFYSRFKSIKLELDYSGERNFEYDCIIRCRFDIGIRVKTPLDGYKVDNLEFDPKLDFNYFYTSYWNQLNAGYADFWEFSNHSNMKTFHNIYNYLISEMLILDSEYLQSLSNWPDSDKNDETTNLIINNQSKPNMNYDFVHSINNHLIEKFYLIKCGLYKKSAFLDFAPGCNKNIFVLRI